MCGPKQAFFKFIEQLLFCWLNGVIRVDRELWFLFLQWSRGVTIATRQFISFSKCHHLLHAHLVLKMQGEWISPELDKNGNPPDIIAIGLQVVLLTSNSGFGIYHYIPAPDDILFLFTYLHRDLIYILPFSLLYLGISGSFCWECHA